MQLVHGVRLEGDLAVPGAAAAEGQPDLTVALGAPRAVRSTAPAGRLVASLDRPGAVYAAALEGDRLAVRFPGAGEFAVDLERGTVDVAPAPGASEDLLALLLGGNVLALILGLRGAVTLHAGGIELDGGALAVAGPAGAGKTTVAALAAAAGARLVSDDMVRLELERDGPLVHRGPSQLRLRPTAASVAAALGGGRETPDGRLAVEAPAAERELLPLRGVVFPSWVEGSDEVGVRLLARREALELLLASARVGGWRVPEPVRAHFEAADRLAGSVPAWSLEVRRDAVGARGLPGALLAALAPLA